jgi:hypothetical protein
MNIEFNEYTIKNLSWQKLEKLHDQNLILKQ